MQHNGRRAGAKSGNGGKRVGAKGTPARPRLLKARPLGPWPLGEPSAGRKVIFTRAQAARGDLLPVCVPRFRAGSPAAHRGNLGVDT